MSMNLSTAFCARTWPKLYPFLQTRFNESLARFSPDGRWVVYQADESGRFEIYAAPFPGPDAKRQVSGGGGSYPRWRRDGKEIFYVSDAGGLMATEVSQKRDEFEIGGTKGPIFGGMALGNEVPYDVTADGKRFIALVGTEQGSSAPLTLVQHWAAGLKK